MWNWLFLKLCFTATFMSEADSQFEQPWSHRLPIPGGPGRMHPPAYLRPGIWPYERLPKPETPGCGCPPINPKPRNPGWGYPTLNPRPGNPGWDYPSLNPRPGNPGWDYPSLNPRPGNPGGDYPSLNPRPGNPGWDYPSLNPRPQRPRGIWQPYAAGRTNRFLTSEYPAAVSDMAWGNFL
ncbi:hypothetical protein J6590_017157 [Homalodisca vitripennis]|nr:hypothetical protein J6590_017157 [Homalodisca vitripennis]